MFMWVSACKLLLKKNQNINAVVFIFFLLFFFSQSLLSTSGEASKA